ncbi:Uncharacterised protein [Exiguobacterium aurantiacum]|uniref:Uncharacterized protein n=1 Tax=Exiguobacterium aurantiacum TaxID=33987 RepID=A0A377FTV4_9BACL|nr:Uncharacterised protein [Exiguobacterium aurantiacum]
MGSLLLVGLIPAVIMTFALGLFIRHLYITNKE